MSVDQTTDSSYLEPTPKGVAEMMLAAGSSFETEVALLLHQIVSEHEHPVTCGQCSQWGTEAGPCVVLESANSIGIAWLMSKVPNLVERAAQGK